MSALNNVNKTLSYLKRNGLVDTVMAVAERMGERKEYKRTTVTEADLRKQRETVFPKPLIFDVVVPVYHTKDEHFRAMIESVLAQSYEGFRLYLGDAGREERLRRIAEGYEDERIVYLPLAENGGISANTNEVIAAGNGDYIIPVDHDDLLEPDALYLFRRAIEKRPLCGLFYTDEDKCNADGTEFYEPNYKPNYDQDLMMSNNYICHLICVDRKVALEYRYRSEYDGAQDHDFLLRVCKALGEKRICHIPRVLYHWRCHDASTADNPESKLWAYEAGRSCVESYCRSMGWDGLRVEHSKHLGFYKVVYPDNPSEIFSIRQDVGAICVPKYKYGRLVSGALDNSSNVMYKGLRKGFTGYMKRGVQIQGVPDGDPDCLILRPELQNNPMLSNENTTCFLRNNGYKILYMPQLDNSIKKHKNNDNPPKIIVRKY